MATATFAERIQDDLAVLVSDPTLIDLSKQRESGVQDTARTLRVCQMAAANVERKLGSVGSYDDTDGLIGDQEALDLGTRLALYRYATAYTLTLTPAGLEVIGSVQEELEDLAESRRQEAGTPILKSRENTQFNTRHQGTNFPDLNDSDAP